MSLLNKIYIAYKEKGLFKFLNWLLFSIYHMLQVSYYLLRGKFIFSMNTNKFTMLIKDYDDASELFYVKTTERLLIKEILSELKPNDVFWDIGANLGFFSLLAANHPEVNVLAVEPNPITVKKLTSNIALNHKYNIEVLELALFDTESMAKFNLMKHKSRHGKAHITFDMNDNTIDVVTSSGDKLIEIGTASRPDIVKIDVEGAEYHVIKGMQNTLSDCRVVFCEVHPQIKKYGGSKEELESTLIKLGFTLKIIKDRSDNTYHIKAFRLF